MSTISSPPKRLYSVAEAAIYLGRTNWGIRGMIWSGKLPCIRDGRRVLLDINDMNTWIDSHKTTYSY